MHLAGLLSCLINRHRANRSTALWNGHAYYSRCSRCGCRVRRVPRGRWRLTFNAPRQD